MTILQALPQDKNYFVEMIKLSADYFPLIFGNNIWKAIEKIYIRPKNLFSFQHTYKIVEQGQVVSMILLYNYSTKQKENFRTGYLFFRYVGLNMIKNLTTLLKLNSTVGSLQARDLYISNLATFAAARRKGYARALMKYTENKAKQQNIKRIVLDVESHNFPAINLYEKLGYIEECKFVIPLNTKTLTFLRMQKILF